MKHAIIAIEDRRFYTNEGVDLRGIGRALYQDVVQKKVVQGGSTITQQFVKNALAAQDDRTLFQKLREAALAYHLTRKWSKEKILDNYLNTIYFGNGAYGIEAAARTYFQPNHPGCDETGDRNCAAQLLPHEAALLAGMVSSPERLRPDRPPRGRARAPQPRAAAHVRAALPHARAVRRRARTQPLPEQGDLQPPAEDGEHPYFTSWIKQQVVDRLGGGQEGARQAFEGGLTDQDDDRRRAAAGGRGRDQQLAAQPRRPARGARGDREQDRHGARDGRRRRLQRAAVQPRHPGPAPARLGDQAVHPRRGAAARASPPTRCGPRRS